MTAVRTPAIAASVASPAEIVSTVERAVQTATLLVALPLPAALRAVTGVIAGCDGTDDAVELRLLRRQQRILAVLDRAAHELEPLLTTHHEADIEEDSAGAASA